MATTETTYTRVNYISPTRRRVMGIVFLVIAAAIWLIFARDVETGVLTSFNMTPGGSDVEVGDWVFSTPVALNLLAAVSAALGTYQLARGFGRRTNLMLGLVAGFFIFSFLTWAAAGQSLNLAGLLRSTLLKAVPLTLGALSGVLCE
ncbi:MAG: ABC transporter permease, partial [Anaerolineales bacterium]|nr:ABC transporter permease [Anaerolineales bacterium]